MSVNLANATDTIPLIWRLLQMPPLQIRIFGGRQARRTYNAFTKPHGYIPFLRHTTFGMALLRLPDNLENPFPGPEFKNFRARHRRASNRGYTFAQFDGAAHVQNIMAIHCSVDNRQTQPMASDYTDPSTVARYAKSSRQFYGVFDAAGLLCGYADAPIVGDTAYLVRIIGNYPSLIDGIMYFLIWELALHLARQRESQGGPDWITYGSYLSCRKEMRIFKKECGFRPHRVICSWVDETPTEYLQRGGRAV